MRSQKRHTILWTCKSCHQTFSKSVPLSHKQFRGACKTCRGLNGKWTKEHRSLVGFWMNYNIKEMDEETYRVMKEEDNT
jgi:hypothetical protein